MMHAAAIISPMRLIMAGGFHGVQSFAVNYALAIPFAADTIRPLFRHAVVVEQINHFAVGGIAENNMNFHFHSLSIKRCDIASRGARLPRRQRLQGQ